MARYSLFYTTLFIFFAICCDTGFAQISAGVFSQNPADIVSKALSCFSNRYIYSSCNEEYRLSQSGYINVPPAATDQFCYGPCLAETHLVLDCVDHSLSNFIFYNKASINDIRSTLQAACGHTDHRGNFNVEEYMQGYLQDEYSSASLPTQMNKSLTFTFALMAVYLLVREAL